MSASRRLSKVSVAILTWNGRHHLEICLPALREQEDPGVAWEVLVLDNGSTDGTAEWVSAHHPEVCLLESPTNLGFCAGNNRLVAAAGGEAVALLNNDTRPDPGWLRGLVAALRGASGDVAAVSGLILDWEGRRLDFARGGLTFDGHAFQLGFRRPLGGVELPPAGRELPFACGGNMLVWKESFLSAGGFDEDYFAYLEDVDLGWRLWAGGERVLFAPEAVVNHRSAATSDLLGLFNRGFLFERNAFLTAYKNYEAGLWEGILPAVLLTLSHRTQTLLVQNNPGGELLTLDPYAGHIANTAARPAAGPASLPGRPVPETAGGEALLAALREKWQQYGAREFLRRGAGKLLDRVLGSGGPPPPTALLTDERTVAQFRAWTWILGHLDRSAEKRREVQARRRRPDGEYFERFPALIVPTYPGDERLFASDAFRDWLPADLPVERKSLGEVMEIDPG